MGEVLCRLAWWCALSWPFERHKGSRFSSSEPPGRVPRRGLLGAWPSTSFARRRRRSWQRGCPAATGPTRRHSVISPVEAVISMRIKCSEQLRELRRWARLRTLRGIDRCNRPSPLWAVELRREESRSALQIALARRSSLFSCSSSAIRCLSAVVTPPTSPPSMSAWRT